MTFANFKDGCMKEIPSAITMDEPDPLTADELDELAKLQDEWDRSGLGDRPQSMAVHKISRMMELEGRHPIFTAVVK
jgi:hypothetical protein